MLVCFKVWLKRLSLSVKQQSTHASCVSLLGWREREAPGMEALCPAGLSSLPLSPSLCFSLSLYKHTQAHPQTCMFGTRGKRIYLSDARALGHGDEHTLAGHWPHPRTHGHPGTASYGRARSRDTGQALPWPLAQATFKPDLQAPCPLFFGAPEARAKPGLRLFPLGRERRR